MSFLRLVMNNFRQEFAVPVATVGGTLAASYIPTPENTKVKRIAMYNLPDVAKVGEETLRETVESFEGLGGIKATFQGSAIGLAGLDPGQKHHTHTLLIVASDEDALKTCLESNEYKKWSQLLKDAGNLDKIVAVHDSPATVIR
jgi:hypothetical protein